MTLKILRNAVLAAILALASSAALAMKTVTLSVPDMSCSTCPIQVKKALSRVPGVSEASASLEKKEAIVTYDDSKTNVEALMKATAGIGFPSTVKK
ncbi:MAG: mercury resistance system periplasmic binding protein MerP [Betaproteobacteria bacterium]|nr:MAG: mercury resistance system periplasmic binding protein MerP [Betaproteobacteria bacterium]